jgi:hypothetical protein
MKKREREVVKVVETFNLKLTKVELLHLRDLFSVALPPDASRTVSEALAAIENRAIAESKAWLKIVELCKLAELPVTDEAPDYIVAPIAPPPMTVFQLQHDTNELNAGTNVFDRLLKPDESENVAE